MILGIQSHQVESDYTGPPDVTRVYYIEPQREYLYEFSYPELRINWISMEGAKAYDSMSDGEVKSVCRYAA